MTKLGQYDVNLILYFDFSVLPGIRIISIKSFENITDAYVNFYHDRDYYHQ